MQLNKDQENVIKSFTYSLLVTFEYNRDDREMKALCEEIKRRLSNMDAIWTDDGNLIYGALVIAFGEYGTSPRSGWFPSEIPSIIIDEINKFIDLSLNTEG